jgi:magnesium transporter
MIKQLKYKNIDWINVESPTPEDVDYLKKRYDLHPVAAAELGAPSARAKVDVYDDFIYLILHFPNLRYSEKDGDFSKTTSEVDFIIGKDFLITTCYEALEPMQEFGKILEANSIFDHSKKEIHAGFLFYYIIRHLYQTLEDSLIHIESSLKRAEKNVFMGKEKEMVKVLANINRNLLDFRWAIKSHRELLESLAVAGKEFFGENFTYYLKAIVGEHEKVWNTLDSHQETFTDLRETNESLLSIKTNEITKALAIIAVIFLPISVIGQIFGMSLQSIPLHDDPLGFVYIASMMAIVVLFTYGFFRYKKWF